MSTIRCRVENLGVHSADFLGALENLLNCATDVRSRTGCFYDNIHELHHDELESVKTLCVAVLEASMQRVSKSEDWFYGFSKTLPNYTRPLPFYQSESSETDPAETVSKLANALFTLLDLSGDDKYLFVEIRFNGISNSFEVVNRVWFHSPYETVCAQRANFRSAQISDIQSLIDYRNDQLVVAISYIVDGLLYVDSTKIQQKLAECKRLLLDLRKQWNPVLFHEVKISSNGEVQRAGFDPLRLKGIELQLVSYIYQESSKNKFVTPENAALEIYPGEPNGKSLIAKLKNKVNSKLEEIGLAISNVRYMLISNDAANR